MGGVFGVVGFVGVEWLSWFWVGCWGGVLGAWFTGLQVCGVCLDWFCLFVLLVVVFWVCLGVLSVRGVDVICFGLWVGLIWFDAFVSVDGLRLGEVCFVLWWVGFCDGVWLLVWWFWLGCLCGV